MPLLITYAIFCRANLEDDFATAFLVIRAHPPLTGIHVTTGHGCTTRKRLNGRLGNRPITHAGHVDHGACGKRSAAPTFANDDRWRRRVFAFQHRKGGVNEDQRTGLVEIIGRAEADDTALILRQAINPGPRGAVEWHFLAVTQKEILAKIFAQALKEKAQMPYDGKVTQYGMALLRDIPQIPIGQQDGQRQRANDANTDMKNLDRSAHGLPQTLQFAF